MYNDKIDQNLSKMTKIKQTIVISLLLVGCLAAVKPARALTYQELLDYFHQPQVLGASTTGLVGYWNFDEGSGTIAADSSGNGNNGTLVNGPTWTTGKIGSGALSFDGADDYINTGSNSSLNFGDTSPWTFSAWLYWQGDSGTSTVSSGIAGKAGTTGFLSNYYYSGGASHYVYGYRMATSPNTIYYFNANSSLDSLNTWQYVTFIADGAGNLSLYKNGTFYQTLTGVAGTGIQFHYLGAGYDITTAGRLFNGTIDDVRVYNRALSAAEVTDLYAYTGESIPPPTPVNGVCGLTLNTCTSGTFQDVADTSSNYLWSCTGSGGGTNASCSLPIPQTPTTNTYWVSPAGAASWVNCRSDTPLAGAAACSRQMANTNAMAGDTVYFRGGTYTITMTGGDTYGIMPAHSGTSPSSRIVFARYANEVPIITGGTNFGTARGVYIHGVSYFKMDGLTIEDVYLWGYITHGSSYNEITNSTFTATPGHEAGLGFSIIGAGAGPWNTHNWIHNNVFTKRVNPSGPCNEGVDLFRIGDGHATGYATDAENDNYNTFENNDLSYAGHATFNNWGMYNVIRNNTSHNEPWIAGCTSYAIGITSNSLTIGTGTISFTTQPGLTGLTQFAPLGLLHTGDYNQAMHGVVNTYDPVTGALSMLVRTAAGSGTYSSWTVASGHNVPVYDNLAYNGLYGHRNMAITDSYGRDSTYVLFEGNRIGDASANPNNDGADNFELAAPKNIVRYNSFFGGMATGFGFKWANAAWAVCVGNGNGGQAFGSNACGGMRNRVYNNTVYHNGYGINWRVYGDANMTYAGEGIAQINGNNTGSTGNIVKNNIVYDNKEGDICMFHLNNTPCSPQNWDYLINNWVTTNGDPKFTNPDLSNPSAIATLPDLSLQPSSPAINDGTYLTKATSSGSNSTTLTVDDALYFQDGSWGSDLARGVDFFPDWIAIGSVNNVVKISSINYSTNTITLASPMTWSNGANIWLYKKSDGVVVLTGSSPDMGAYEYTGSAPPPSDTTPPTAPTGVTVN
jgi:hypothetical protein